jgi:hypothetical protein
LIGKIYAIVFCALFLNFVKAQTCTPTITVLGNGCAGQTTTLAVAGATSYTWSANAGGVNTDSVFLTNTVSDIYTVTASTGTCVATNTVQVFVIVSPTVSVNSGAICDGNSLSLIVTSNGFNFTWNPATGLSSTTGSAVIASPVNTTVYTVTVTAGPCYGITSNTVTVNPNPTVTVNSATMCPGNMTTLNANGASTYTWVPGGFVGNPLIVSPASTTNYTVMGTAVNTCTNATGAIITVNPTPTITPMPDVYICNGVTLGNINIAVTPSGGTLASSWFNSNTSIGLASSGLGNIPSFTASNNSPSSDNAGMINVSASLDGCPANPISFSITVYPTSTDSFILYPNPTPHVWDAYPNYTGGTPPYTYSWDWGDGSASTTAFPSHTYSVAAFYNVCVTITDANGCTSTYCQNDSLYRTTGNSSIVQINVLSGATGIKNANEINSQINIYPNPATNSINVISASELKVITIINSIGETVLTVIGKPTPNPSPTGTTKSPEGNVIAIDISKLQKGIYFIQTRTNGKNQTNKFIKE